jgi:hypothetical protein
MYSTIARRRCLSPSGTIRSKHSLLIESTNRSAKAFRFGLLAGRRTIFTPLPCVFLFVDPILGQHRVAGVHAPAPLSFEQSLSTLPVACTP